MVSNAPIAANDVVDTDVWGSQATVTATILQPDRISNPVIRYRQRGQQTWNNATTTVSGTTARAHITGLTPGTTYEYSVADDEFSSNEVKSFTTEAALQLPNASFEEWSTDGKAKVLFGQGGTKFWDSGNYGSATMSKNITQLQPSIKLGASSPSVGNMRSSAAEAIMPTTTGRMLPTTPFT